MLSYNLELKDEGGGFIGDRVNKGAFRDFIDEWRKPLRRIGQDPFGHEQSSKIAKKKLDDLLTKGDPESAGVVQGAIESFAQELTGVLRRFLKLKSWKKAERVVFGGGFSGSRVGELAIGRASVLLKNDKIKTEIRTIRNDPDEAGLIGAAHLAPAWMFKAHDAILAVDIGGTNMRAGIVCLHLKEADDMSKAEIAEFELWRHGDEKPSRHEAIPEIGEHDTTILMHNDAVVQGLSEAPSMRDVDVWAAFTIGTGLGNALYKNREQ